MSNKNLANAEIELDRLHSRLRDQTHQTLITSQQITAAVLESIEANGGLRGACDTGHPIEQIVAVLLAEKNHIIEALQEEVELQVARYAKLCQYSGGLKAELVELKAELKRRDERHNEKDRGKPTGG